MYCEKHIKMWDEMVDDAAAEGSYVDEIQRRAYHKEVNDCQACKEAHEEVFPSQEEDPVIDSTGRRLSQVGENEPF